VPNGVGGELANPTIVASLKIGKTRLEVLRALCQIGRGCPAKAGWSPELRGSTSSRRMIARGLARRAVGPYHPQSLELAQGPAAHCAAAFQSLIMRHVGAGAGFCASAAVWSWFTTFDFRIYSALDFNICSKRAGAGKNEVFMRYEAKSVLTSEPGKFTAASYSCHGQAWAFACRGARRQIMRAIWTKELSQLGLGHGLGNGACWGQHRVWKGITAPLEIAEIFGDHLRPTASRDVLKQILRAKGGCAAAGGNLGSELGRARPVAINAFDDAGGKTLLRGGAGGFWSTAIFFF